jgi:hypothetical protein|tara:strand:+ start:949 stop:1416 length:468 start_codon:yes stop_codon:yes gene_type:complete
MKNIILSFFLILIIPSCGFKIIEQDKLGNFYVDTLETFGEKRINHYLKNKLLFTSKKGVENQIKIKIISKKNKTIKEKNIRNEVTKYNISVFTEIEYEHIRKKSKKIFNITENGNFNVSNQNSETRNNERKLIDLLTENIAKKIIKELILQLDDS